MSAGRMGPGENGQPDYTPMAEQELRDLEREAGRPLSERQAQEYLLRKRQREAVNQMLEGKRR
jgi:hypothetical protein